MSYTTSKPGRCLGVLILLTALFPCTPATAADTPKKYALLIGCTKYQREQISELWGPANDVPMLRDALVTDFGFPKENVRVLLGWPDEPRSRASYANIAASFKELIAKTGPNDQVVILLSGHGTRIPIAEPKKNQDWKANHLAFLPIDVKEWSDDKVENAVLDDELKGWLEQLRKKKSRVLIVFDCCHAGSMSRGVGPSVERMRTVQPKDLGIPDLAITKATEKAKEGFRRDPPAGERSRGANLLPTGMGLKASESDKGEGSVTAFYACQPWEETPELPRPADAARVQANYYGLLSWTLLATIKQQGKALTYRELGEIVVRKYQSERGTLGPIPFFEGDLDLEVLGIKRWPNRSAVALQKVDGKLRVTAGVLMGLTDESVLAVYPPLGDDLKRDPAKILGYIEVVKAGAGDAEVRPCARGNVVAVDAKDLPDGGVCKLVERSLGQLTLKLAIARPTDAEKKREPKKAEAVQKLLPNVEGALRELAKDDDFKDLFKLVDDSAAADWILGVEGDRVLLWQGTGAPLDPRLINNSEETMKSLGQPSPRRLFGSYPADSSTGIKEQFQSDLQKIFTWRSIWKIAAESTTAESKEMQLEIVKLKGAKAKETEDGRLVPGSTLNSGQRAEVRLRNTGSDLWVTLIFLDNDLAIRVKTLSMRDGERRVLDMTIESAVYGPEGIVVLTMPMAASELEPNYAFLAQAPLQVANRGQNRGDRMKGTDHAPNTLMGKLMKTAVLGKGTRAAHVDTRTDSDVLSWTWTILPEKK